jgi:hypothetical protein
MFRQATQLLARRVSDMIDEMLLGDFDYIAAGDRLYADIDYQRMHPHHSESLTWTPAAGRGFGPQRPAVAGPVARRPGSVPDRATVCASPVRTLGLRPSTAAARRHTAAD